MIICVNIGGAPIWTCENRLYESVFRFRVSGVSAEPIPPPLYPTCEPPSPRLTPHPGQFHAHSLIFQSTLGAQWALARSPRSRCCPTGRNHHSLLLSGHGLAHRRAVGIGSLSLRSCLDSRRHWHLSLSGHVLARRVKGGLCCEVLLGFSRSSLPTSFLVEVVRQPCVLAPRIIRAALSVCVSRTATL